MTPLTTISSPKAAACSEPQKSSPFELGLDWTVALDKPGYFVGRRALEREKRDGSVWKMVGLEVDWVGMEKLYGAVGLPRARIGKAERDIAGGARVERGERFELVQSLFGLPELAIQVRELLARVQQCWLQQHGAFERDARQPGLLGVVVTQPQEVLRLRELRIQFDGALERLDRFGAMSLVVARESQLVEHSWGAVIEPDVGLVALRRRCVAVRGVGQVGVAELLQRTRGRRVEF